MASSVLVARMHFDTLEYLAAVQPGLTEWVVDARKAASFESLREATRQAMRLPSRFRAFALPAMGDEREMRAA